MSSMGSAWPDDGMDDIDWSFLGSDSGYSQPLTGIIPVTVGPPQTPSIIPLPQQDQSAVFVPPSAYGPPPVLQDPNVGVAPPSGTPSAGAISDALGAAGYFPDGAASFAQIIAGDKGLAKALDKTKPFFDVPLAVGAGIAGGFADIHQGTSPLEAFVGNTIRSGLVYGAGMAGAAATPPPFEGAGGMFAGYEADKNLPPAPQIGHAVVQGILNPPPPNPTVIYPAQYGGRPW